MTYTEIYDEVYGRVSPGPKALSIGEQRAWNILRSLYERAAFDHWWDGIPDEVKDEIFEEIRRIVEEV